MLRSYWLKSVRNLTGQAHRSQRSRRTLQPRPGFVDVAWLETRTLYSATVLEHDHDHDHDGDPVPCVIPPYDPQIHGQLIQATPANGPFPDDQTFLLHSRPGASKTVYLDFDGYVTTGTQWNIAYGRPTITTPEFTLDGVAGFSPAELTAIQTAWQRVAEAFSPFDVNVTTEDPGVEALRNTGGGDQNWGIRVAIGGSSSGVLGISAGGVAYLTSFNWNSDTPTYVFPDSLGRSEKNIADATAHEVGHTLGLRHDGLATTPVTDYYTGHGTGPTGWAPIMGVGYSKQLVQWSRGEYPNANQLEDDLQIITTQNGFTYRTDDHGSDAPSATELIASGTGDVTDEGVIERNTDTDWFRFLGSGDINLTITGGPRTPMLDIEAQLFDANGNLVASSNPVDSLNATITANVPVGDYFLRIDGVGKAANGNDFGYTDYASIGQFFITGNVGDNFPPVINDQNFSVQEDAALGTAVGTVVATDPDVGDVVTYAITGGNTGNLFVIDVDTGEITLNGALDYETRALYPLTVEVTDRRGLTDTAVVTINVTDVNESPVISPQNLQVFELSVVGTVVGTVSGTDPDIGQSIAYSILSGNTGTAFAIDPTTGVITVNNSAAIDYNAIQSFSLTVRVTDSGTPNLAATGTVTINVLQVNLPPTIAPQTFSLPENGPVGTAVGTVAVTDGNINQSYAFQITGGNVGGAFAIHPTTGVLTIANSAAVNFEVTPTFSLAVQVTDNGVPPLSGNGTITINLSNVNDPPKVTPATFSVIEDAVFNTVVGTVLATDDDVGQTRAFSITGGNVGNAFKIHPTTGVISVNTTAAIDFEATPVFSLIVTATDNGVPVAAGSGTITINVTNINDPPTGVSFANTVPALAENAARLNRVKVADIVINDDGLGTNQLSLRGTDMAMFEIANGALFVKAGANLDFETKKIYSVNVDVDDTTLGNTPDATAVFTLNILDVNEAPIFPVKSVTLPENSPEGTVVASGYATDPDVGQSLTYTIKSGNRNNAFAINANTGEVTVNNPAALDWENEPPYELKIDVKDNGTPALITTSVLKIALTNVNDAPLLYGAYKYIPENLPFGAEVLDYKVVAYDQDAGQTLKFAIIDGNDGNAFAIDPNTGVITVNNPLELDYENQPPFELKISVTDNGTPPLTSIGSLRIALTDVNDAPRVYNGMKTIPENSPVGFSVLDYNIVAKEQDLGQSMTFAIVDGNRDNAFAIDPNTGIITVKNSAALDFETAAPFDLVIEVTDSGTPALKSRANLLVKLTNVNDAPRFTNSTVVIPENLANNSTVFDLKTVAKDDDPGQTLTYAITGGNFRDAFKVHPQTGIVSVSNSLALDWENVPPFFLNIRVTDSANPALSTTGVLRVNLSNVNEAPHLYDAAKTIPENLPAGAPVLDYTIVARDPEATQVLQYAIIEGNTANAFAIHPTSGLITVNNPAAIDFEANPKFDLVIKVTDSGSPPLSSTAKLTIQLTDIKEPATVLPATFTLPENSPATTVVGTVTTTAPPETGKTRSFAISGGNPNNAFSINAATGQIRVNNAAALNFEGTPSFALTVTVTDTGGGTTTSGTGVITVNLTNVNEAPVIPPQSLAVKLFAPVGSAVGTVTATDPDVGQTRTFAIVSGNGVLGNIFAINPTTGQITVNNILGVLTLREYNLGIRVTDNGSPAASSVGTVRVVVNATGVVAPLTMPSARTKSPLIPAPVYTVTTADKPTALSDDSDTTEDVTTTPVLSPLARLLKKPR